MEKRDVNEGKCIERKGEISGEKGRGGGRIEWGERKGIGEKGKGMR